MSSLLYIRRKLRLTIRASASHMICVPRLVRFFCDRRRSMCWRLALLKRTLPLDVILKRFLALLLFLSLGISIFLILQIFGEPGGIPIAIQFFLQRGL